MGLKRKRSIDDASPVSISSFGSACTPDAQSPTPMPLDGAMDLDLCISSRSSAWDFSSANRIKPGDWGYRTRKRFRDNRPDERVIHETTLQKLFSAQRNQPHASPIPSDTLSSHPLTPPSIPAPKPQKSTLHSFWKQLPAPPVQPPTPTIQISMHHNAAPPAWDAPRCEDCDTSLHAENEGMDVDMDTDMDLGSCAKNPFACNDCGRSVCGTCAVVSSTRHCLQCATSGRNLRRWW